MNEDEETRVKTPKCPTCHKPVWREGHMAMMAWRESGTLKHTKFLVCMHCSGCWAIEKTADGMGIVCVKMDDDERRVMWPKLKGTALQFGMNRLCASLGSEDHQKLYEGYESSYLGPHGI